MSGGHENYADLGPESAGIKERQVRVLYLHGFEEHHQSPKPMLLKGHERLEVHMPDLDVYFTKRNGPIVSLFRSKKTLTFIAAALATRILPTTLGNLTLLGLFGLLYVYRQKFLQESMKISVNNSLAVAVKALKKTQPDIVVGFSWGGCLACHLLESELWKGPTVLLAPAYDKLHKFTGKDTSQRLVRDNNSANIVVVQGLKDQLINPLEQEEFCKRNGFRYITIEKEIHNLWGYQQLPELVIKVATE
mmetsp:Transcript_12629/g.16400  ORF Transcript_12629/g.16400 Transcript_12629/m.16400 type:complete len:248 (+) Transcript_12629:88-831(+)